MKRALGLALTIVLVGAIVSTAHAQAPQNDAKWGQGSPTGGQGKITGSGTYTEAAGWTAIACIMTAIPTGGGPIFQQPGAQPAGGNWGAITIQNLQPGQYTVFAQVTFRNNATGARENKATATAIV